MACPLAILGTTFASMEAEVHGRSWLHSFEKGLVVWPLESTELGFRDALQSCLSVITWVTSLPKKDSTTAPRFFKSRTSWVWGRWPLKSKKNLSFSSGLHCAGASDFTLFISP
uniref:Putative secreted protein n=1 Tax=Ixodes ricinus TaxID=34613 RepID=A0A6B0UK84_IXORI